MEHNDYIKMEETLLENAVGSEIVLNIQNNKETLLGTLIHHPVKTKNYSLSNDNTVSFNQGAVQRIAVSRYKPGWMITLNYKN